MRPLKLTGKRLIKNIIIAVSVSGNGVFCSAAGAGVYKWVDASGKIHYSDAAPANEKQKTKLDIKVRAATAGKDAFGTRNIRTKPPVAYTGSIGSRRIHLEKVLVELEKDSGGRNIVGRDFSGISCARKDGGVTWSSGRTQVNSAKYASEFNKVFRKNNYAVADGSQQLFAGQKLESAELSVAAVITELEQDRCRPNLSGRGLGDKLKVASYIKIKWSVFDNLERKVVYEVETEGSDSSVYEDVISDGSSISRYNAFSGAIKNLLSKKDFAALLEPGEKRSMEKSGQFISRLSLRLSYGIQEGSFTNAVDKLKQASVTVRSVSGHGSGFVLTHDGYIVTNAHVTGDSKQAIVVVDGKDVRANIIRVDEKRDVALLKIDAFEGLQPVELSQNRAREGETIYIIGTPLDEMLSHTVTRGIISAYRTLKDGNEYYQTDAAINPGNSGGPVFNRYGEVIGISVSGLFTKQGTSLNINFLIPIDEAMKSLGLIQRASD